VESSVLASPSSPSTYSGYLLVPTASNMWVKSWRWGGVGEAFRLHRADEITQEQNPEEPSSCFSGLPRSREKDVRRRRTRIFLGCESCETWLELRCTRTCAKGEASIYY
jgi:hypothetical protein